MNEEHRADRYTVPALLVCILLRRRVASATRTPGSLARSLISVKLAAMGAGLTSSVTAFSTKRVRREIDRSVQGCRRVI